MTDTSTQGGAAPLRPRDAILLVVSQDLIRERIDVRRSQVYDVFPERLLVAQTAPPLSEEKLGARIEAVFVPLGQTTPHPLGFESSILALVPDYPLEGGQTVQALAIAPPQKAPEPTNLRMHCRFPANDELGLSVKIKGSAPARLMDISAGGMFVFFPGQSGFAVGQRLSYRLLFRHGDVIRGQADIVDATQRLESDAPLFQDGAAVRLKFLRLDVTDARLLDRTLHRFMFLQIGNQ